MKVTSIDRIRRLECKVFGRPYEEETEEPVEAETPTANAEESSEGAETETDGSSEAAETETDGSSEAAGEKTSIDGEGNVDGKAKGVSSDGEESSSETGTT